MLVKVKPGEGAGYRTADSSFPPHPNYFRAATFCTAGSIPHIWVSPPSGLLEHRMALRVVSILMG